MAKYSAGISLLTAHGLGRGRYEVCVGHERDHASAEL